MPSSAPYSFNESYLEAEYFGTRLIIIQQHSAYLCQSNSCFFPTIHASVNLQFLVFFAYLILYKIIFHSYSKSLSKSVLIVDCLFTPPSTNIEAKQSKLFQ